MQNAAGRNFKQTDYFKKSFILLFHTEYFFHFIQSFFLIIFFAVAFLTKYKQKNRDYLNRDYFIGEKFLWTLLLKFFRPDEDFPEERKNGRENAPEIRRNFDTFCPIFWNGRE